MHYRRLGAALLAGLVMLSQAVPTFAAVPKRYPLVLGVSRHPDNGLAALDAFMDRTGGHAPGIWSLWSAWGGGDAEFPDAGLLDGIVARGAVPMLFWEPVDPSNLDDPGFAYSRIIAGDHDAYLRRWAQAARDWGGPFLAKFAHEMNGNWFPWSIGHFDNTPSNFIKAWRHIVRLVRAEGATNVRFVWAPISPCGGCPSFESLYPGDGTVSYAGFSTFDWYGNKSLVDLVRVATRRIARITKRPIIIGETGTPAGNRKIAWIRDGYRAVYAQFPQVRAIVYFDVRVRGQPDWRLTRPTGALKAFRALYDDKRFTGQLDDTRAPTNGRITIEDGRTYVNSRRVTLTPRASDDIAVTGMQLSEDPTFADARWKSFATSTSFDLSAGDGHKTVHARFRDITGNVSSPVSDSIDLERVLPKVSEFQVNDGALSSTSRTIEARLEASDAESGLSAYRLSNDGRSWSPWTDWPEGRARVRASWRLATGDSLKTLHAQVRDGAGNISLTTASAIELHSTLLSSPPAVAIDAGAEFTDSAEVILDLHAPTGTTEVRISNDSTFPGAAWEPYVAHRAWVLDDPEGEVVTAVVHVGFRSDATGDGTSASDDIVIDPRRPHAAGEAAPVITGGSDVDPGVPFTATLDTRATDQAGGSGVGWMQLSTSSTFNGAVWERYEETGTIDYVALARTTVFVRFRDRAGNVSTPSSWVLADPALPSVPTQVAPVDHTTTTSRRPTFRWRPLDGGPRYQFQIDDAVDFASPLLSRSTTGTSVRPGSPLPKGKLLYWRVRVENGSWSAAWRFRVPAADGPGLRSPADGDRLKTLSPTMVWASVPSATDYQLQLAADGTFSNILEQRTVGSPRAGIAGLARLATYHWRVRAKVGDKWGAWSAVRDLITPAIGVPVLGSPDAGASVKLPVALDWSAVPGAVAYRVQVCPTASCATTERDVEVAGTVVMLRTPLAQGTHYWRVRAQSASATPGAWTPSRRFVR